MLETNTYSISVVASEHEHQFLRNVYLLSANAFILGKSRNLLDWLYRGLMPLNSYGHIMVVGDAHVFPGFLTPVLTQLPKPPTTFLTCFGRGDR